ncbi:MAG TPA: GNAT family N-acetyltransferase [Solirubrobacteraceae bacterium]|nr:GNAT family N-acetyltransferase [Solirubrobacteraceae bacterium]
MSYRVKPFSDGDDLESFDCGHAALNAWLRKHPRRATRQGTRKYLLIEDNTEAVVGYFALAPHLVERDALPRSAGRGAPSRIPAILLGKLALDARLQGQGIGAELLTQALVMIIEAARAAGGRLVVVDAVDEKAASFYRAHDFQPSPADTRRLIMKLSTAEQSTRRVSARWPM